VAGVFNAALQDYDASLLIAALEDVRGLLAEPDARMALHVNFREALERARYAATLARQLPAACRSRLDGRTRELLPRDPHRETMIAIILMLIVAVAGVQPVAMLAMGSPTSARTSRFLRTLGASPRRV